MTTSLLLHMDGGHGVGAPTLDATGKTVTVVGTAILSTTQSKFGGASLALNGTTQYLTAADCPDFDFGSGDFTVEAWVYATTIQNSCVAAKGANAAFGPFRIQYAVTTGIVTGYASTNGSSWITVTGSAVSANTWTHLALVRYGTSLQMYVNGVAAVSAGAVSGSVTTNSTAVSAGATSDAAAFVAGYMDEVRITKGLAVYTTAFTPPTAPFAITGDDQYWDSVVLAMHMDGANAGTTFTDLKGKTPTIVGGVTTSTTASKFGGASAYFDGVDASNSSLTFADSVDWHFTGAYTVEFWINPSSYKASGSWLFGQNAGTGDPCPMRITLSPGGLISVIGSSDNSTWAFTSGLNSTAVCSTGTWYHVALTDDGTTARLFVNGALEASRATWSKTDSTQLLRIGGAYSAGDREFNGYIDDLRVTKGVARYTAAFIPPTDAFAVIGGDPHYSKVALGMHMDGVNGGTAFIDTTGKTVTANGNVVTSTTQSKFGGTSALFDGTTDWLSIPDSADLRMGAASFTIEGFFYFSALPAASANFNLVVKGSTGGSNLEFVLYLLNTAGVYTLVFASSTSGTGVTTTNSSSAWAVTTGAWNHIAVVRDGSAIRFFIGGIASGTGTDATTFFGGAATLTIGAGQAGINCVNGYIDDLRITKGAARY